MIVGLKEDAWLRLNPLHPGRHIAGGWLDAVDEYPGMSVSEAAEKLGVSRAALSRIVDGRAPVTPALAMKMEALGWATADTWLRLQTRYDIAQARKRLNQPRSSAPAARRIERMKAEVEQTTQEAA